MHFHASRRSALLLQVPAERVDAVYGAIEAAEDTSIFLEAFCNSWRCQQLFSDEAVAEEGGTEMATKVTLAVAGRPCRQLHHDHAMQQVGEEAVEDGPGLAQAP